MTTNATDHLSAMQRMAAISRKPVAQKPQYFDTTVPVVARYALGHSAKSDTALVRVVISFPPTINPSYKNQDIQRGVTGKSPKQIAKFAMLMILEYLIKQGCTNARLFMSQQLLVDQFNKVKDLVPTYELLERSHAEARDRDARVQESLLEWQRESQREHSAWLNEKEITARIGNLAPRRILYVDASLTQKKKLVGVGFAWNDIRTDSESGAQTWNLQFGATRTRATPRGMSTLAELKAIHHVLATQHVLDNDIKKNRRGLVILSDSKWGVKVIKAVRSGKPVHTQCDFQVMKVWVETAKEINELLNGIEDVTFKWVKGHGTDMLNDAVDRLALAARRNVEFKIGKEPRDEMNARIVDETIASLKVQHPDSGFQVGDFVDDVQLDTNPAT